MVDPNAKQSLIVMAVALGAKVDGKSGTQELKYLCLSNVSLQAVGSGLRWVEVPGTPGSHGLAIREVLQ